MKCRICSTAALKKSLVKARGGEKKQLFYCEHCHFAFFNRDHAALIRADHFEQQRLLKAGLGIPDIRTDFNNGLKQSRGYRKLYIGADDRGQNILEVGPSWGYFLKVLKSAGARPVGLEANPVRAEFVRRNLKIPCYEALDELEQKGLRFKKIFLFYVIQYIKDPVEYLSRLMKWLERGGSIYIVTPNFNDVLKDVWMIKEYQAFFYEKMTVSYYSVRALEKLARAVGREQRLSFDVSTKQGYSLFNHLLWYFNGKPRTTGLVGADRYALDIAAKLASSSSRLGSKLSGLIREFDHRYKSAIEKMNAGNQVVLIIKKRS